MRFFELQTPRHLLDKLGREYDRLSASANVDNIFNFYVTAYHIKDYLIESGAMQKKDAEDLFSDKDPELWFCRDLANMAKHLSLKGTARNPRDEQTVPMARIVAGGLNESAMNEVPFNGGLQWMLRYPDGRSANVVDHAYNVVKRLVDEFAARGIA
ncbi:hypothetical protein [Cupriavidus sp. H18C2]|uniref:hypothetical protein n=1 Tax=Cupriavidus sp. H18C2 TaxID=3241602 RepID=UPI003BF8AAF7